MKNFALSLVIIFSSLALLGQNCVPDQSITKPGIYPNYLDTARVGVAYEHTLQILAVKDTTVVFSGNTIVATVDSVQLDAIYGLPASFSYGCEPERCVYTYQSVGCAKLSGNPISADIGVHPLEIVITSYARWNSIKLPVTDTINTFVLVVEDSATSSIRDLSQDLVYLSPNPVSGSTLTLHFLNPVSRLAIMNQQGLLVKELKEGLTGSLDLDISELSAGVYHILIQSDSGIYSNKFIRID